MARRMDFPIALDETALAFLLHLFQCSNAEVLDIHPEGYSAAALAEAGNTWR